MTNTRTTRVAICDPYPLSRMGLRAWLKDFGPQFQITVECGGSSELCAFKPHLFDLLIIDIDEEKRIPWDSLHRYNDHYKSIIYTALPELTYAVKCYRAGAHGYVSKRANAEELLASIKTVLAGGKQVSGLIANRILINRPQSQSHESLSPRELEMLIGIGNGLTVSQVARKFSLSVKTVSTYRVRILEKMGLQNNAQIMDYVIRNELDRPKLEIVA